MQAPPATSPLPAPPSSVSVIGAGSWGTALTILLARNIKQVKLWGRNAARLQEMAQQRCNSQYLPGLTFPPNLSIETNFDALLDESLAFVIAVPSHAFSSTVKTLHQCLLANHYHTDTATIICATKGFDPHSGKLLCEVATQLFAGRGNHAAISGPSFALETAKLLPTALTMACADRAVAESLAAWFRTPTTRVYFNCDLTGVQLGGAIKNVIAIATGISDGLGFGANARAALITRGLAELTRLGIALGGQPDTFSGLTGVGDLVLTCTDDQSRNRRFGLGLGEGKSSEQICREIGQQIEGIHTVRELHQISRRLKVEMPITEQVYQVVHQGYDPNRAVRDLLQRDPKAEHDESCA